MNETRWKCFFDALHAEGPLVFLVSDGWAIHASRNALARWRRRRGYSAVLLTTDRAEDLRVATGGIFLGEHRIRTIWRQFPIIEARRASIRAGRSRAPQPEVGWSPVRPLRNQDLVRARAYRGHH